MHEVTAGTADRSYGIHVAELAGLPVPVVSRAKEVLQQLEEDPPASAKQKMSEPLPLFSYSAPPAAPNPLEAVNPDELTPKEALELLYRLKSQ